MMDGTIDGLNDHQIHQSHTESAFLRALTDTTAMVQGLRLEDLSAEEGALLRRLLRELVAINRVSSKAPSTE